MVVWHTKSVFVKKIIFFLYQRTIFKQIQHSDAMKNKSNLSRLTDGFAAPLSLIAPLYTKAPALRTRPMNQSNWLDSSPFFSACRVRDRTKFQPNFKFALSSPYFAINPTADLFPQPDNRTTWTFMANESIADANANFSIEKFYWVMAVMTNCANSILSLV